PPPPQQINTPLRDTITATALSISWLKTYAIKNPARKKSCPKIAKNRGILIGLFRQKICNFASRYEIRI
ncbi:MAG: hypothetical protein K2I34_04065, partial [Paramuribaculum sp.]|nr:hypothetical protein [Paramuribaculum sp.]